MQRNKSPFISLNVIIPLSLYLISLIILVIFGLYDMTILVFSSFPILWGIFCTAWLKTEPQTYSSAVILEIHPFGDLKSLVNLFYFSGFMQIIILFFFMYDNSLHPQLIDDYGANYFILWGFFGIIPYLFTFKKLWEANSFWIKMKEQLEHKKNNQEPSQEHAKNQEIANKKIQLLSNFKLKTKKNMVSDLILLIILVSLWLIDQFIGQQNNNFLFNHSVDFNLEKLTQYLGYNFNLDSQLFSLKISSFIFIILIILFAWLWFEWYIIINRVKLFPINEFARFLEENSFLYEQSKDDILFNIRLYLHHVSK